MMNGFNLQCLGYMLPSENRRVVTAGNVTFSKSNNKCNLISKSGLLTKSIYNSTKSHYQKV